MRLSRWMIAVVLLLCLPALAARKGKRADKPAEDEGPWKSATFKGLALRGIGPALVSGRISDIAVHPRDRATYLVAVASGGVWKTTNNGTTWKPVFDGEGSYSIGCVTIDPSDPLIVWVGTGENNSQRSVAYGDGVYRSLDGGETWTHMGLKDSEHIAKIVVHPEDSNVVWVAAQGPLWRAGGERGVYKTLDGGKTWKAVLEISEHTGVTDLLLDPRNPDVLHAAAYQRRRRVWTLVNGGPESAIYKSRDGGETWEKSGRGLPKVDMGRIGLALAPANPDVLYAIVEAADDAGGFFRSDDAGASWSKQGDYVSGSPQYYQEIVVDPRNVDRVYSMDTWMMVTQDGGKSFERVGERSKHVDNHSLWIDPEDTDYLLAGCDGGVYESYDRGTNWNFKANLPITQFYKVTPDNATPFYNVYGGTQDNFTLGGPSRTTSINGITNRDWFVTLGGDGFEPQIDPENPDIIYSQLQYGVLSRFDRRSGEGILIQPEVGPDQPPLRWNWDSALIISPHLHTRLYFAAQRIFRSDDRGDSWTAVSGDLTRNLDRNQLEVMGRIQSVDAVAKNRSTSFFGNIVSLSESPLREGLLYAGTDDGLIQVLEPETGKWRKIDGFAGVPTMPYVSDIETSRHAADTVYAAFDLHKDGDFKPYLMKSDDRGRSWTSIGGDLPERGTVYSVVEDHVVPELLFAGTEFGVFFTRDGGRRWIQLQGGMPVIAVRDVEIQRRENDLVVGTFGRGIFILDDYTPLRGVSDAVLEAPATLFPVKSAPMYMESAPLGIRDKAFQGDGFYTAPNPPTGAVFTYHLKEALKTRKEARQKLEKDAIEEGGRIDYPGWDALREEDREEKPAILLTIRDADGETVRTLVGPTGAGMQRVAWDLRFPASIPTRLKPAPLSPFSDPPRGPIVVPGSYSVQLAQRVDGEMTPLGQPQTFDAKPLGLPSLPAADRVESHAFQRRTARLQRAVLGAVRVAGEARDRIDHIKLALLDTPGAPPELHERVRQIETRLKDLQIELSGDATIRSRQEPTPRSISQRVSRIVSTQWTSSAAPTQTSRDAYRIASEAFGDVLASLRQLLATDLARLEKELETAGAPWTPGRIPDWP